MKPRLTYGKPSQTSKESWWTKPSQSHADFSVEVKKEQGRMRQTKFGQLLRSGTYSVTSGRPSGQG